MTRAHWLPLVTGVGVTLALVLLGRALAWLTEGRHGVADLLFALVIGVPIVLVMAALAGGIFWLVGALILSLAGVSP